MYLSSTTNDSDLFDWQVVSHELSDGKQRVCIRLSSDASIWCSHDELRDLHALMGEFMLGVADGSITPYHESSGRRNDHVMQRERPPANPC